MIHSLIYPPYSLSNNKYSPIQPEMCAFFFFFGKSILKSSWKSINQKWNFIWIFFCQFMLEINMDFHGGIHVLQLLCFHGRKKISTEKVKIHIKNQLETAEFHLEIRSISQSKSPLKSRCKFVVFNQKFAFFFLKIQLGIH